LEHGADALGKHPAAVLLRQVGARPSQVFLEIMAVRIELMLIVCFAMKDKRAGAPARALMLHHVPCG